MTVGQILENAAALLEIQTSEMIVSTNGIHLGVRALNTAKRRVEMIRDFNTQDTTVRLAVGINGVSLDTAVLESDGVTVVRVKTVKAAYLRDATVTPTSYYPLYIDSKKTINTRIREMADRWIYADETDLSMRYRSDNENPLYSDRLQLYTQGRNVYLNPQPTVTQSVSIDASIWLDDYDYNYVIVLTSSLSSATVTLSSATVPANFKVGTTFLGRTISTIVGATVTLSGNADTAITAATRVTYSNGPGVTLLAAQQVREDYTNWFTETAHEYLMWAAVVELNHKFKSFVPRQDGYLNPPEKLRDEALSALLLWDDFVVENTTVGIR